MGSPAETSDVVSEHTLPLPQHAQRRGSTKGARGLTAPCPAWKIKADTVSRHPFHHFTDAAQCKLHRVHSAARHIAHTARKCRSLNSVTTSVKVITVRTRFWERFAARTICGKRSRHNSSHLIIVLEASVGIGANAWLSIFAERQTDKQYPGKHVRVDASQQ